MRSSRWIRSSRAGSRLERLGQIPLFAACTGAELELIARNVTEYRVGPGEVLVQEGKVGREFLVIAEGRAVVMVGDQPIARVGPGDFVGEVAMLDRGFRTASVVAETDMVVEICGTAEFAVLLAGAPTLTRKLLGGLAQRLRTADERPTADLSA